MMRTNVVTVGSKAEPLISFSRLVQNLESIIGGSWQEMQAPRDDNGFRQGFPGREPSDPWTLISDKQADIDEYVDRIVDEMQWGEQHR